MALDSPYRSSVANLVDAENGLVDRLIFSDQEVYELELERIFARAWNFVCHESQIANTGDFFTNYIGEDRVIVVRDRDGGIQVMLNTCRHRGNAVCRAEEGHAASFMCTYHGWTYDLKGNLTGVPGGKDFYGDGLDRGEWGLRKAAQVDSYKGFVFATMDAEAPPLEAYLGEVGKLGLSLIAERGDLEVVPGIQKFTIGCNWKLAVDNLFDWYHVQISHASSRIAGYGRRPGSAGFGPEHMVMLGEYGHAISGPELVGPLPSPEQDPRAADEKWRERPEAKSALGPLGVRSRGHPNIFPNLWVTNVNQVCLRLPRGPYQTEIWWFTLLDKNLSPEMRQSQLQRAIHTFGPAGILEQDDGENWNQSTRGTRGVAARRAPLNYSMGLGRGEIVDDEVGPPRIHTNVNEHAQLWTYRAWAEWMAAESWADLQANHSPVPSGRV